MTILTDSLYYADVLDSLSNKSIDAIDDLASSSKIAAEQLRFQYFLIKQLVNVVNSYIDEGPGSNQLRYDKALWTLKLTKLRDE